MRTVYRALLHSALAIVLFQSVGPRADAAAAPPSEIALGNEAYAQMVARDELLPHAPEARLLAPIAAKLKKVADPVYGRPFTFYIDRSLIPNAFVIYGPRVYVDRGLVRLADSQEELAGVLCHEMSHAIHHDGTLDDSLEVEFDNRTKTIMSRIEAATHTHFKSHIESFTNAAELFVWKRHSRGEEERADLAGASLCSRAGINPWGLVWMFRKINTMAPNRFSFFSDHPSTHARIVALEHYFRSNPATFAKWSPNQATATRLR